MNDKNQAEQYAFIRKPKAMMTEETFTSGLRLIMIL